MKKLQIITIIFTTFILLTSCVKEIKNNDIKNNKKTEFALVIHGGAGYIYKGRYTEEEEKKYIAKLTEALDTGYEILEKNGSAVDAVESTIKVMEDSPLFNSAKGAVYTAEGNVELDASIMSGKDFNAGGVAGIKHVKNPISLARKVMEYSPHVLLFGDGAEDFADKMNLEKVDNSYFKTETMTKEYNNFKKKKQAFLYEEEYKFGTVGCAALDKKGNLAAGTSTGGMMGKQYGRVGDSPIIGAGTYANNETCALSATGHGEFFIINAVTHEISSLIQYKKMSIKKAADLIINDVLVKQNALGGVIGLDKYGNITMTFNTEGMFRGYRVNGKKAVVKMYGKEKEK
ncbi:MAG: beta-aspartyl-peptidase [Ignavibacteriae bacterium]|nr:MAG: beta-aspartyl-peptidase [Ignavibacteriota bacterium]